MAEENKTIFHRIGRAVVAGLAVFGLVVVIALVAKSQAKPNLPVSVITRNAIFGPGRVLRLINRSAGATLDVIATLKNPTTEEEKRYDVTISPGGWKEIGYGAGWIVHTGDQATLYSAGYQTMIYNLQ